MDEDCAPRNAPPRVLVLCASARRDGNSRLLGQSLAEGARGAGASVELVHVADHVKGLLRDCTTCRDDSGACTIEDGFRPLFLDKVVAADALVYATPIWWYGTSGVLKTFLDRMFCYIGQSYGDADRVVAGLTGKRAALLLSAEESNLSARLGIVQQMQEMCRYLHHSLVGVVTGIGNRRGEVASDPSDPLGAARMLGERLFDTRATDYRLDTERSKTIWTDGAPYPAQWR